MYINVYGANNNTLNSGLQIKFLSYAPAIGLCQGKGVLGKTHGF